MAKVLQADFFAGAVLDIAPRLLGSRLCRRLSDGSVERWPITETEAYDGPQDLACHAARGRTRRTEVMFGPAGRWYVYLCYGMHWMLNVVTGATDYPAAVLIRGAGDVSGPGRLTKQLEIDGRFHGQPALASADLWIEGDAMAAPVVHRCTARIGVAYAGPDWGQRPYRFIVGEGNHSSVR